MIAALLLVLQSTDSAALLRVVNGMRVESIPVVQTAAGPVVPATRLANAMGARVAKLSSDRFSFATGGTSIELTLGLPFARVGRQAVPMSAAPVVRGGWLHVPLALVTEILPSRVRGLSYDSARRQLTVQVASVATAPARSPPARREAAASPSTAKRRITVVVDAGHGGPDRGMSGPAGAARPMFEKDVTLAVARRLRDALQSRGLRVVMTRTTDTLIALADRGRIANQAGAQLFISIHVNAANPHWKSPAAARGFETYFLADAKTEDEKRVEEMENDAARYDLPANVRPGDELSFIVSDMIQNEHLRESSELAETVQTGLRRVHPGTDRGVKQAGFKVLVTAHMPAVLVEIGFGTNAKDAAWMRSGRGQQTLAEAIARSTMAYLARYERRTSSTSGGAP